MERKYLLDNVNLLVNHFKEYYEYSYINNAIDHYSLYDLFDYIYPGWQVRRYGNNIYLVKNMKMRGIPKRPNNIDLMDYIDIILTKNNLHGLKGKIIEEIDDRLEEFVEDKITRDIEVFYEEYISFCNDLGYEGAVVGRSNGWWGILLSNRELYRNTEVDVQYLQKVFYEFVYDNYDEYIDDNMDIDEIVDLILDNIKIKKEHLCVKEDFIEDIKKIDDYLETSASDYENSSDAYYVALDNIIERYV